MVMRRASADASLFLKKALLAIGFSLLLNIFFLRPAGGIFVSLFLGLWSLFFFIIYTFFQSRSQGIFLRGLWHMILCVILSGLIAWRANEFVLFILAVSYLTVTGFFVYLNFVNTTAGSFYEFVTFPFRLILAWAANATAATRGLFSTPNGYFKELGSGQKFLVREFRTIIVGLLFGLPLVVLILGLLRSADPIFDNIIKTFIYPPEFSMKFFSA